MMKFWGSVGDSGGGRRGSRRRWLKRRLRKRELYRLSPQPEKRKIPRRDRIRHFIRTAIRTWWVYLLLMLYFVWTHNWIAAAAFGVVTYLLYHLQPSYHPLNYVVDTCLTPDSEEYLATMVGIAGSQIVPGNKVDVLNNGDEFYPPMLEAIESAQESVTMEQYIFWDGAVARRFSDAFAERASKGIPVKLLVDGVGGAWIGEKNLKLFEQAGVELAWFGPLRWYAGDGANNRTHRKSLIIDGRIAFTGGAGIADHWVGTAQNQKEWRDVHVRVEGPAVLAQQTGFAHNWLRTTGEMINGPAYFPKIEPVGDLDVQTIMSSPATGAAAAGSMYFLSIQCAKEYIYVANPYFVPTPAVLHALHQAAERGVEIKIMIAGKHNDSWWARYNSLRYYGRVLDAGVELFEYEPTMMHQKTMVVDGIWATIGTTNLDNRSFALNEETNLCFHDASIVGKVREIFLKDLKRCHQVTRERWSDRSLWQRLKENTASLIEDQV